MFSSLIDEIQDTTVSELTKRQLRALTRITGLFTAGSGRHSIPDAPTTLVRAFAFDDAIAVAAPVLSQSTALSDSDLVANANTQGQGHLYAIAHRQTISEVITEIVWLGSKRVAQTQALN